MSTYRLATKLIYRVFCVLRSLNDSQPQIIVMPDDTPGLVSRLAARHGYKSYAVFFQRKF